MEIFFALFFVFTFIVCAAKWANKDEQSSRYSMSGVGPVKVVNTTSSNPPPTSGDPVVVNFRIKGTSYRDDSAIAKARAIEDGDILQLEKESDNEYDPYAIKVLFDGVCIGYVEKKYSMAISVNFDSLKFCTADDVSHHDIPFINGMAFFKPNTPIEKYVDTARVSHVAPGVTFNITMPGDAEKDEFPELNEALKLVYDSPEKALPIFLSVMEKEDGLYAAHEALKCLRSLNEYDKERELILMIIEKCKQNGLEDYIPTYENRLKSVDWFISRMNKKNDINIAKEKFKVKEYVAARDIYLKYYQIDEFSLAVADGLRKCYDKLGDYNNEILVVDYILEQSLSDGTLDKYRKIRVKLTDES